MIHTLIIISQELFGEVDEKKEKSKSLQKLPFSFDDLCRSISVRQDGLFKRLVEFQREEQEDIEHRISEIEAGMNDEEMEDDFVQRQRYLLSDEVKCLFVCVCVCVCACVRACT